MDTDARNLPGMEILGFYDGPNEVWVERPRTPRRAVSQATTQHGGSSDDSLSARIAELWETTEINESALEWWKPHVIARRKLGGRRIRIGISTMWALAALAVLMGAWTLVSRPERVAQQTGLDLSAQAQTLVASLPALSEQAGTIGQAATPDLSAATAAALDVEQAARDVFTLSGSVDDESVRSVAVASASTSLEASSRLSQLVAFRITAEAVLIPPSATIDSAVTDLSAATETVTSWRAGVEAAFAGLAVETLPVAHETLAEWTSELEVFQSTYLDTLREGGSPEALQRLITAQEERIAAIHAGLLENLGEAGVEIVDALEGARSGLEGLIGG